MFNLNAKKLGASFFACMMVSIPALGDSLIGGNPLDCEFTGSGKLIELDFSCELQGGKKLDIQTSRAGSCLRKLRSIEKEGVELLSESQLNRARVLFAFNRTADDPTTLKITVSEFFGSQTTYPLYLNFHLPPKASSENGSYRAIGDIRVNDSTEEVLSCSLQSRVVRDTREN